MLDSKAPEVGFADELDDWTKRWPGTLRLVRARNGFTGRDPPGPRGWPAGRPVLVDAVEDSLPRTRGM